MAELNGLLERTFEKIVFQGALGTELFLQDDFSRSLLILLEQKIKAQEIQQIDEFEAFLENMEGWYVSFLRDLNRDKKLCIYKAFTKLKKLSAQTIFECLARMSEDERKHFILKNQAFIEAKRIDAGIS